LWIQQRVNQKPSSIQGQTMQWTKENGHKDKQWSTKHYTETESLSICYIYYKL
jgi:hypothetical protein